MFPCGYTFPPDVSNRCSPLALQQLGVHMVPTLRSRKPNKIRHLRDFANFLDWGCAAGRGFSKEQLEGGDSSGDSAGEVRGRSLVPASMNPVITRPEQVEPVACSTRSEMAPRSAVRRV